ncbi:MAG: hypothetical protein GYB32_03355 [Algicola sp.]|nr:hypothetical protein [Algicola sp.]
MKPKLTTYLIDYWNTQLTRPISDRTRWLEIMAVILTGIGKFVFMDYLNWRLPYVVIVILAWSTYVMLRYRKNPLVLQDWGFRRDNFKSVLFMIMPFVILAVISFFVIGYIQNTLNLSWHILPLLITYPIWGTIQQFLTIALVAGNLSTMKSIRLKNWLVVLITAMVFSLVHYPSIWLVIGTFTLALVYTSVYLKTKNLYVLGLFHGWLGALFYYTVVNQDPFADVFLKYFH